MAYYQIERVVDRYQNEEGQTYTKTRCFYGKTKEEAEYKIGRASCRERV